MVTGRADWANGVLLRAVAIPDKPERLAAGPALLARCFGIDRSHDAQLVHPDQGSWQAAAARAICSPEWDRNPDSARVLCWANRSCDRLGQQLRAHRHGTAAARAGEALMSNLM